MRRARAFVLMLLVVLCLSMFSFLHFCVCSVSAAESITDSATATGPTISILNPGPDSNPSQWNASSTVRYLGTSDFVFYSNETSYGSTFFVNLTITNVTNLYGWGAGLVFQNMTLQYVGYWLPPDNVFSGAVAAAGDTIIPAEQIITVNSTFQEVDIGASYIQRSQIWTFNGTGTLAQVEFRIIAQVNSTTTHVSSSFAFDPYWTGLYFWPTGSETPTSNTGNFVYDFQPRSFSVSISPSSVVIDVGQSQLFTSTVNYGVFPFTYQWFLGGDAVFGATNSTWTFTPTLVGLYTVSLQVTDSVGNVTISYISVSATVPMISVLNPGPESYPSAWNASSTIRYVGTPDFDFYPNETSPGSTFFVNVTVANVTNLYAWSIGLIYNNATLQYVAAWLPNDNVFAGAANAGASVLVTPVVIAPVNSSCQEIRYGASYSMPSPSWTFNGTGILAQLEFQIITQVNSTNPQASSSFAFDPVWTTLSLPPPGVESPTLTNGNFVYEFQPLSVSVSPSSVMMGVGWSQLFSSTVAGGTFPFTYQWFLGGDAVFGAINSTWTFTPTSVGSYTVSLQVTDGVGTMALSSVSVSVTVPMISVLNPGPESYPSAWNASSTVRYVGTPDFDFYSNETSVGSTFFVNITVTDVADLYGWAIGLVYDSATLQYVTYWLPTDNVFSGAVAAAGDFIISAWASDSYNSTYRILELGASYLQGNPQWSFNGTGTLAQVEFRIVGQVNSTNTEVSSSFAFDPDWTGLYFWPSGSEVPASTAGNFVYEFSAFHKVAVTNITASSNWVYQGQVVNITVTAWDAGNLPETATVTLYYNITGGDIVGAQSVVLASGENATLLFAWNTTGIPINYDNYTLTAVVTIATGSNALSDGTMQVRIMGDVNNDRVVNMNDIMTIVSAFGSYPGHSRWNPNCDLNQHGKVDLSDIVAALMNFGKSS